MYEWNATTSGDHLWTNMLVGEIFPETTTPSTWSIWQQLMDNMSFGDTPAFAPIAGRPYLNYSLTYSFLLKLTRKHERVMGMIEDSIGTPPPGVEIPAFPIPWKVVLLQVLPREFRNELKKGRLTKAAPQFLEATGERCSELRLRVGQADKAGLISLWQEEIRPLWHEIHLLQDKMNEELNGLTNRLKKELAESAGDDEANALLTKITGAGELASLGPLVGLGRVKAGQLSHQEYLQRYGHRGPHENELAEPRPHEDPTWLDRSLAEYENSSLDITALIAKRDAEFDATQEEVTRRLPPKQAQEVARRVTAVIETNHLREATRSELTRVVDLIRAWFLRAGELSGLGDDVFFLTIDETLATLSDGAEAGRSRPATHIPDRREAFEAYRTLPPLPTWIRGRFDPFEWAADPNRRSDLFDAHVSAPASEPAVDATIKGQPGSAGRVEGLVQRIDSPEEGDRLQRGEILVTRTTNVGWTPLFPRAAAVVTDVGGSLSHAAIVARELGIPAVVGCRDATARLHTGDRVRVDGERGLIEILNRA